MFHGNIYLFFWLLVVSLAILIACSCRLFSSFMTIACRSTKKCRAYQTLYKITHRYNWNHLITKQIIINSLLCWSVTLLNFIQTLDHTDSSHYRNENQLAVWVILEIFWNFWTVWLVLNIDWVQFVLKNSEIPHSIRTLYDK